MTTTQTKFTKLASPEVVEKTMEALKENNFTPLSVETKEDALEKIKELIPEGVSLMNGTSTTLHELGYIDLLKTKEHKWNNLHDEILAETDPEKQAKLRRHSVISDYYVGSAHAITEDGEIVISSNSGSQLPHLVFTSANIILVVSSQKIVPTLADAFARVKEHIIPLEDKRMMGVYGFGTMLSKTLILHKESAALGRKIVVIIVNEKLGF